MLHRRCILLLVFLFWTVAGWAQAADRIEIYGGYSFAARDFTGGYLYNNKTMLDRGWNASANIKLNRVSQFVADFGGYYLPLSNSAGFCNFGVNTCSTRVTTLMFGPQFSLPLRIAPFAHALFGTALASQNNTTQFLTGNHSFIMALGGGVDYGLTRHFALRAQADFLRTRFTNGDNQVPFRNNNARVSAGVAVRF